MRTISNEERAEILSDFLKLMAERVEKRGGTRYDFTAGINTPQDDVATISLEVEVTADDEVIEEASKLLSY